MQDYAKFYVKQIVIMHVVPMYIILIGALNSPGFSSLYAQKLYRRPGVYSLDKWDRSEEEPLL